MNINKESEGERKPDEGYVCDCGLVSKTLANYKKHMLTHTGERPFKCNKCPKAFRQQHHLTDHQRTHTGERPFKCDECGATFVQKSSLNLHKKKHLGIKPHKCKLCNSAFRDKTQLNIHIRKHTGEKPYQCEKCGQAFSTSTRLKFHLMIHTGEKRYECEECGARFREEVTLQQHRGVHVNLGPFICTECGQEFSRLAGLSLHRKVHSRKLDYLYVYNKEANEAFAAATKSQNNDDKHKGHSEGTEKSSNTENDLIQNNKFQQNEKENPKSVDDETDLNVSCVPETSSSLTFQDNSLSPRKRKLSDSVSNWHQRKLKENLVSNINDNTHNFDSHIQPEQVKTALINGKLVETEDDKGNAFLILLPPSLKTKDVLLVSDPPPSRNIFQANSEQNLNHDSDISKNKVVADANNFNQPSPKKLSNNYNVKAQEDISAEEPNSHTMEVTEDDQETHSDASSGEIFSMEVPVGNEVEWDIGKYSKVKKDIHSDGTSLLLWNDGVELNNEITYIIDEGSANPVMIHSQEVESTDDTLRQSEIKNRKLVGKKIRKQRAESDSNSPLKVGLKSKKIKEKKIRIPKLYKCGQCGKDCKTSSNYIAHMRTHSGERPYFCDWCKQGFKQIAHLRAHVRIHTGERPYVCDICNFAFTQASRLKSHKKTQHSGVPKKIKKKEKVERLNRHRSFYCKICMKTFINECYKIEHMKSHRLSMTFVCNICGIKFKSKNSLLKHRLSHTDDQCVCEVCGMSFVDWSAFSAHQLQHGMTDAGTSESDLHVSVKIGEDQDFVVIVPPANDSANNVELKEKEINIVEASNGQEPHSVIQVSEEDGLIKSHVLKKSVDSVELKVLQVEKEHVKEIDYVEVSAPIVAEEKDFESASCTLREKPAIPKKPRKIKDKDNINYRVITDKYGRKIWACNLCDKTCTQSSNLHTHLRTHTGERPYVCNVCFEAFKQITHLKDHMSRHTGIRPHKCSECDSYFTQKSAINRHIKQIHNGKANILENTQPVKKGKENRVQVENVELDTQNEDTAMNECSLQCKHCNGIFKQRSLLESHECLHRPEQYVCDCEVTLQRDSNSSDRCIIKQEAGDKASVVVVCGACCKYLLNKKTSDSSVHNVNSDRVNEKKNVASPENGGIFSCCQCQASLPDISSLKSHLRLHYSHRIEVCNECGMVFRRASSLKFHQNAKHGRIDERYRDYNVTDNSEIKKEPYADTKSEMEELNVSADFESDGELEKETDSKSCDEQQEDQPVSNNKTSNYKEIFRKKRRVDRENVISNKSPIINEGFILTDCGKYACRNCYKIFSRLSTLKNHLTMWCTSLKDVTQDSDIIETAQEQLSKNMKILTAKKRGRPRKSEICSGDDETDLENSKINTNVDAEILTESVLDVKIWDDQNPSVINTTEVDSLSQKKDLTKKQNSVLNTPLYCKICKKYYTKVNSYKVHMSTHLNKRQFKCDMCDKAFNQKAHLTSHYRRHTGERPYKCHYCSSAFTQPHSLKSHIKKLHPKNSSKQL